MLICCSVEKWSIYLRSVRYDIVNNRILLFRTIFRCHNFSTVPVLCYDGVDNEGTLQWWAWRQGAQMAEKSRSGLFGTSSTYAQICCWNLQGNDLFIAKITCSMTFPQKKWLPTWQSICKRKTSHCNISSLFKFVKTFRKLSILCFSLEISTTTVKS